MQKVQSNFKNSYKASYIARNIAQWQNHGSAIQGRIQTVLNQLRESSGINKLTQIEQQSIQTYADTLQDRLEQGELSTKTASGYISALNDIAQYTNEYFGKDLQSISARENGLSRGSIEYKDRAVSQETHQEFKEYLSQQQDFRAQALSHSVSLQRSLGLRLRESISIKSETIKQALKNSEIHLSKHDGTKNSQPRTVPITTEAQRQALKSALDFMRDNHLKSLIPTESRLEQYRFAQNTRTQFNQSAIGKMDYHGERHFFAQEMCQTYTKKEVSEMLGHHREEILKYYVG